LRVEFDQILFDTPTQGHRGRAAARLDDMICIALYRNDVSVQRNDLRHTSRPYISHRAAINITAFIGPQAY